MRRTGATLAMPVTATSWGVNGVLAIRISTDRMLYATGLLDLAVDHDGTRRNS